MQYSTNHASLHYLSDLYVYGVLRSTNLDNKLEVDGKENPTKNDKPSSCHARYFQIY